MIYTSFPYPSNQYPGNWISWSQISHFVTNAVKANFKDVTEIPYGTVPCFNKEDILISNIPNKAILSCEKTILVDNDTFHTTKWKYGKFMKHGYNALISDGPSNTADPFFDHVVAAFIKTNPVSIRKIEDGDEDVRERYEWLTSKCRIYPMQHPIDKEFFSRHYNENFSFDKTKILVYNMKHLAKYSQALIDLLVSKGYKNGEHFVESKWLNSQESNQYKEFNVMATLSYSEGFPYLGNEYLTGGMALLGNEEWWDGYGFEILRWTYNPKRQEENADKIDAMFKEPMLLESIRRRVHSLHMKNPYNEWSYFNSKLIEEIRHWI